MRALLVALAWAAFADGVGAADGIGGVRAAPASATADIAKLQELWDAWDVSNYRYIDIYVKRDGQWRIVSVQITRLP